MSNGIIKMHGNTVDAVNKYLMDSELNRTFSSKMNNSRGVIVTDVRLLQNGTEKNKLENNSKIEVSICLEVGVELGHKISFELEFKNNLGQKILYLSLSLGRGVDFMVNKGKHNLDFSFLLPYLSQGQYSIDVIIVEPYTRRIDTYDNAISFEIIDAYINESGWTFKDLEESIMIFPEGIKFYPL
jgi:hypothetical protein